MSFLAPEATPVTAPFWDGVAAGKLVIQRGVSTGKYFFYPRPFSPYDLEEKVEWVEVSGRARLVSYIINARPIPGVDTLSPVIALVELDEGPRLMTNIVDVEPLPENLPLDMRLVVVFRTAGEAILPVFTPEVS
ncbi:MAG: Zn-ribbon domain-containing OB-fold protein [Rhodoglobus sp.]